MQKKITIMGKKKRVLRHPGKMAGILFVSVLCGFTGLAGYVCTIDINKGAGDIAEEKVFLPGVTVSASEAVLTETVYDSTEVSVAASNDSGVRNTNVGYVCITVGAFEDNFGNYIYRFQFINRNDEEAMSKYYVE